MKNFQFHTSEAIGKSISDPASWSKQLRNEAESWTLWTSMIDGTMIYMESQCTGLNRVAVNAMYQILNPLLNEYLRKIRVRVV